MLSSASHCQLLSNLEKVKCVNEKIPYNIFLLNLWKEIMKRKSVTFLSLLTYPIISCQPVLFISRQLCMSFLPSLLNKTEWDWNDLSRHDVLTSEVIKIYSCCQAAVLSLRSIMVDQNCTEQKEEDSLKVKPTVYFFEDPAKRQDCLVSIWKTNFECIHM